MLFVQLVYAHVRYQAMRTLRGGVSDQNN
jgi:hypothetical protein